MRMLIFAYAVVLLVLPIRGQEFTSPRIEAITSWIGNSYGGGKKWVQQDIRAMAVTPDGTVFTNAYWDEAGGNAGEYRDGELIRYAMHTHGWGYQGGDAVAANSRYVYLAVEVTNEGGGLKDPDTWPPKGSKWLGISRRLRSDIAKGAPFAGGTGGKGDTLKQSCLVVAEVPENAGERITGICVDESRLYVANPAAGAIHVFDANTMQAVAKWKIRRPGPLVLDASGIVWMLQRRSDSESARLVSFDANGEQESPPFDFAMNADPIAFCVASDGRVLVADDNEAQQIRIYAEKHGSLAEVGVFGERGGIASGIAGAFGDRKLNHVTALGVDANNNLIVAQDAQSGGGGTVLESYRLGNADLNWRLFGLTFVDMADVDPASDTDVFTKEEHFRLDYSQPAGSEWSYASYTIDRFKYPQDPRLHLWSAGAWVRNIGDHRILFVTDMNGERLQAYRFAPNTDGEIAIPCGLFAKNHISDKNAWPPHQPEKGEWIWRDANGNGAFDEGEYTSNGGGDAPGAQGWCVDSAGGVWLATESEGLRYFPSLGLDPHGNPQWDYATMHVFPHPDEFQQVKRVRYDAANDVLYLGGTTADEKNQHWKPMGPMMARYDGWLRGRRTQRWQITLPYANGSRGHESCEPMGFAVAGDFLFVPYTGASQMDGVKTGRVEVFRVSDGGAVGHMEPSDEVGEIGLQDIRECITAHRRSNGEYIVLLEDDYKSKIVMYRIQDLK